jgi:two-component system chemotaxis response regulator CheY
VRILVADDDAASRRTLKAMVASLGHDCLVASDGLSAWELLRHGDVDVLLADWSMPGLDGAQLCRRVRAQIRGHYTYLIIVTTAAAGEQVLEGMNAGADDFIVKPVDALDVRACLVAAERVTSLHRELARMRFQLEEMNLELLGRSLTDPLTNLGNRRRMQDELLKVHARAQRSGELYCVAMFDIDYFKLYNDHYGHPAGDDALRQVATCLQRVARAGESVYRYGGEEFLLVMPLGRPEHAVASAERILHAVNLMSLPHVARPVAPAIVTVSAGVACHGPASPGGVEELIERADRALYAAKAAGRNRVRAVVEPVAPGE